MFTRIYQGNTDNHGIRFGPNGCIVKDGIVYFASREFSPTPSLVMYNISGDSWSSNDTVLHVAADGIVEIDGVLYVTASEGGLMEYTIGSGGVFENVKNASAGLEADWPVNGAADMCVGKDETLVFPQNIAEDGNIYYVELGHDHDSDDSSSEDDSEAMMMSVPYFVGFLLFGAVWIN